MSNERLAAIEDIMQVLAGAKDRIKEVDVTVERKGKIIVLPDGMSIEQGIASLKRKAMEEATIVAITEAIDTYPLEGAVALMRVIKKRYDFTSLVETPSFWGPKPPQMVGVQVDKNTSIQVPWGRMELPNITGFLSTSAVYRNDRWQFLLAGEVARKDEAEVHKIAELVRESILKESIYRGKAIDVAFQREDPENFDLHTGPKFLDTSGVNANNLVFSDTTMDQVRANLFTPIEKSDICRRNNIPLNRKALIEGPFGVGKSMTAAVLAQKCVANGWTFINVSDPKTIVKAIQFARKYQPSLIFVEDIDSFITGERSIQMNDALNNIDGVDGKTDEVMIVFTTNNVDNINKALIRPGRIDTLLSVRAPDARAAVRLLRVYGEGVINPSENLDTVGEALAGQIPATIAEVVRKAKLWAATRSESGNLDVNSGDLLRAAAYMKTHIELLEAKPVHAPTAAEVLGTSIGKALRSPEQQLTDQHLNGMIKTAEGKGGDVVTKNG